MYLVALARGARLQRATDERKKQHPPGTNERRGGAPARATCPSARFYPRPVLHHAIQVASRRWPARSDRSGQSSASRCICTAPRAAVGGGCTVHPSVLLPVGERPRVHSACWMPRKWAPLPPPNRYLRPSMDGERYTPARNPCEHERRPCLLGILDLASSVAAAMSPSSRLSTRPQAAYTCCALEGRLPVVG